MEKTYYENRKEIPEDRSWNLTDIFSNDAEWEKAFTLIPDYIKEVSSCKGQINSGDTLLTVLQAMDKLDMELSELYAYARMKRDENNADDRYQSMAGRIMDLYFKAQAEQTSLITEIAACKPAEISSWQTAVAELQPYEHLLDDLMRRRPHILSEKEEKILSRFGSVAQGIHDTFTMIDNVDIQLGEIEDTNGEIIKMTAGRFGQLRDHPDRNVRKNAFKSMHEAYGKVGNTIASLYQTQIKSDILVAESRDHIDTLSATLFENKLPISLYQGLIDAVHASQPVMERYFKLRQTAMALDDLHIYDTYVPIIKMPQRRYTWEQACDLLRKGLAPLGSDYLALLEKHLTERWIDVYENKGKTSGAYSWGTYRSHPYVLMNYSGTLSDVFTLAHEVGHSMHTWFSSQRPYVQAQYPIFLAEIASTVNENLMLHVLLSECDKETEQGRQEQCYLLNHFLESFRQTVFRQTMFAEFEWEAHKAAEQGQTLTARWLCDLYGGLLNQYFAPVVQVDDFMRWEWARIPHFYTSYYVYQYATGFSAAVALSQQIVSEGQPAVDRYMTFLGSGGSDYPLNLLKKTGVDLSGPQPVQAAMQVFDHYLRQLEAII